MADTDTQFFVVKLPDDPKLRSSSIRRRALTARNQNTYSKAHTARSVTKPHQHHLLTATSKTLLH